MTPSRRARARLACAGVALSLVAGACSGTRLLTYPTVRVEAADGSGSELGVSTEYGVVFLGRRVRSGEIDVTVWYGDGPSIEASVVEPVGGDLYTAPMEIVVPSVGIEFRDPPPDAELVLIGRRGRAQWQEGVELVRLPEVDGALLAVPDALAGDATAQTGAGLYVRDEDEDHVLRLYGLVSGRVRLGSGPEAREYLTVVGPQDLWRLAAHHREHTRGRRWTYREDVVP